MPSSPHPDSVTSDPDRGIAVNTASDPQRPGEPIAQSPADTPPRDTSAEETPVTEPGPGDVERGEDSAKSPNAVRSKVEG